MPTLGKPRLSRFERPRVWQPLGRHAGRLVFAALVTLLSLPLNAAQAAVTDRASKSTPNTVTMRITVSPGQLVNLGETAWASDKRYVAYLRSRRSVGEQSLADTIERRHTSAAHAAAAKRVGQVLDIRMGLIRRPLALGRVSPNAPPGTQPGYAFWTYNFDANGNIVQSDPVTHFFAPYPGTGGYLGLDSTIRAEVMGPASPRPWYDAQGEYQMIWGCIDIYTNQCQWYGVDYQVQWPAASGNDPAEPRYHTRLFQISLADGPFTIAAAHHDQQGHTCSDQWNYARDFFTFAVPPADIASQGSRDEGTAQSPLACGDWDGQETDIWMGGTS